MDPSPIVDRGFEDIQIADLQGRLRGARLAMIVAFGGAVLSTVPFEGYAGVVLPALGIAGVLIAVARLERGGNLRAWRAVALLSANLPLSIGIAVNGGIRSAVCPLVVVVAVAALSRTSGDGKAQVTVAAVTVGSFLAAVLIGDAAALATQPDRAIVIVAATAGLVRWSGSFVQIERAQRINALVDALTGLPNRAAFEQRAGVAWRQAELMQRPLSLIALDIDHFKLVNDTYGHARGDAVLRGVAELLSDGLRSHDAAFRIGGEEFVILHSDGRLNAAVQLAERLREQIDTGRPGLLHVSVSIGVWTGMPDTRLADAMASVDEALYASKHAGRNQVSATHSATQAEPAGRCPPASRSAPTSTRGIAADANHADL